MWATPNCLSEAGWIGWTRTITASIGSALEPGYVACSRHAVSSSCVIKIRRWNTILSQPRVCLKTAYLQFSSVSFDHSPMPLDIVLRADWERLHKQDYSVLSILSPLKNAKYMTRNTETLICQDRLSAMHLYKYSHIWYGAEQCTEYVMVKVGSKRT